jgi:hypothetical protein
LEIRPYVRVVTLLKQSDPDLKYEVFERLNTGGEALFPQEIRNAAHRGALNDLMIKLSGAPFLRQQLKISKNNEPAYLQMQDVEYVLRYFMMRDSWKNFSGDYRRSMDHYMERNREPDQNGLKAFKDDFQSSLARCEAFWGDCAFKRFGKDGVRNQFLAGMYDAQMVAVSQLTLAESNSLAEKQGDVLSATETLFEDNKEFDNWVRVGTNTRSSVENRINAILELLKNLA